MILDNKASHTVIITAGDLRFEQALAPSYPAAQRAIYLESASRPEGSRPCVVTPSRTDADVYVAGQHVGKGPLLLYLGTPNGLLLTAHAPGCMPERHWLAGYRPGSAGMTAVNLTFQPGKDGPGSTGPVQIGMTPVVSSSAGTRFTIDGPVRFAFPGPEGKVAIITESGAFESLWVLDTKDATTATTKPLLTWRIWYDNEHQCEGIRPVGWLDDALLIVAPELPSDTGESGRIGDGLWEVNTASGTTRRIAWWEHWCLGRNYAGGWLTADGRAAVIHTRFVEEGSYFRVIDLATGIARSITAMPPYFEPADSSIIFPSPDGWQIAWATTWYNPGPGEVVVLDLATGDERILLTTQDETIGTVQWTPDSRKIAISHARPGERYWIGQGGEEEPAKLYPARFVVMDLAGQRIAEICIEGEILAPSIAWSSDSALVAVKTVTIHPYSDPVWEWITHAAVDRSAYAGPLIGPLERVWQCEEAIRPGEDMGCRWLGFLGDGQVALGIRLPGKGYVIRMQSVTGVGQAAEAEGYYPAELYDYTMRTRDDALRPLGLLAETEERGLFLVRPDATVETLITGGGPLSLIQWTGQTVVATDYRSGWQVIRIEQP